MSSQARDLLSRATGYFPDLSSRGRRGDRPRDMLPLETRNLKLETLLDLSSLPASLPGLMIYKTPLPSPPRRAELSSVVPRGGTGLSWVQAQWRSPVCVGRTLDARQ